MKKIQRTNGKKYRQLVTIFISLLSFFVLVGCYNPITPPNTLPTPPEGKGSFTLALSDTTRTILPNTPVLNDFLVYRLIFTFTSGDIVESTDRTNATLSINPIFLEPGIYNLNVYAYKDEAKTQLAAQGMLNGIVISSGNNTSANVTLKALLTDGTGSFGWNISIPADVSLASMTITPGNAGGTAQQTITLSPPIAVGNCDLNAGFYNLTLNLEKTDGKMVVWKELLYVYRNLSSVLNHTFTNVYFSDSNYTITYKYNDGELTTDGTQSILHGATLIRPNDPSRNGYNFGGWYTDNNTFDSPMVFNQPVIGSFTLYAKWDKVPVTSVELNKSSLSLTVGDTETVIFSIFPTDAPNKNISWFSSNPSVAFINNGTITAISPGTAVVIVTTQDGEKTAQCVIRVYNTVNKNRLHATSYAGSDKIKYSYSYNEYDYYYIYLGELAAIPMFYRDNASYNHYGVNYTYTFSTTDITKTSIRNTVSNSSVQAIGIVKDYTYSTTNGWREGWEISVSGKSIIKDIFELKGGAKWYGEDYWERYISDTTSNSFQQTTSLTDTLEHATEKVYESMRSETIYLTQDDKPGYYRWTMFGASDVYLYVVRDSNTGDIYYEFKEKVIPGVYSWRFEYSETPSFSKSDDSSFEIDISILENLPKPVLDFGVPGANLTDKLSWLQSNAESGGEYIIEVFNNESISPKTLSYSGRNNITIVLKGMVVNHTIGLSSNGNMFRVGSGVKLILDNGIILFGRSENNTCMVNVDTGGSLVMKPGSSINSNTGSVYSGAGVVVSGAFTMEGGEISENAASGGGSGVIVYESGIFTMKSGEISRNKGGGVRISRGSFSMEGGKIVGNTSGGGVSMMDGFFIMKNGEISGNTATVWGGGVEVSGLGTGTFIMEGGEISGNTAAYSGGGVFVDETFIMKGGKIFGNSTGNSSSSGSGGGGVYVHGLGTFTMEGGEILGNICYNTDNYSGGGGVYLGGIFTMKGGVVSGNTAASSGGGVFVEYDGTFNMENGIISGNTAANSGGGVYVYYWGMINKTGGTIYGYTAGDNNSNVVRSGSTVNNNLGHAVYAIGNYGSMIIKRKETNAGSTVNLYFYYNSYSGGWDF